MINIGICDDDKRCRDILKQQIINTINEKEICFTEFSNAGSMIKRKDDLDVVFLDMELPDMDGRLKRKKWLLCPDIPKYFTGIGKSMHLHILKNPLIPGN